MTSEDDDLGNVNKNRTAPRALSASEQRVWSLHGFEEMPATLAVEEAGRFLGVGRSTAYELVKAHRLGSIRIGRSRRIPKDFLLRFFMAHLDHPTT